MTDCLILRKYDRGTGKMIEVIFIWLKAWLQLDYSFEVAQ